MASESYYQRHKAEFAARARAWREANPEKVRASRKKFRKLHPERDRASTLAWRAANPDKVRQHAKNKKTPERKAARAARVRTRRAADPLVALEARLRNRLTDAISGHGGVKSESLLSLIGCTVVELKAHLESLFLPGMTWENRARWHIDHKRPCASFNLADPEQQKACFHFTNLQPLWAADNIRKKDHWAAS